jgi:methionyl-tRNA formyltransferase
MGTPEFAVASLEKLYKAGCNIVAVITAPDKPAGRGMNIQETAVKKFATEHGLNILQPDKLKNPSFIDELKSLHADLQVVVAFRMLPEIVWNMPPMGTLNLHGSLLPQYRGAAPINWAIINGEKFTGVTTFKLKHEIDTGDILLAEKINIEEEDTAGTLHDKMKETGASLLLKTIQQIATQDLKEVPQEKFIETENNLQHAPKIYTETCKVDWNKSVAEVNNLIRGLSPYPAAFTELNSKKLKVYSATAEYAIPNTTPGNFETDKKNFLKYACKDGYLNITELQLEGKKRMNVRDFLSGYRFDK